MSGITIDLNKSTEQKHELTEDEIAKINFNKKGSSQKFNQLYDTSVEHTSKLEEHATKLEEHTTKLEEHTSKLEECDNVNESQQDELDIYKNMLKSIVIKFDELHPNITFNLLSSDTFYIAFENSEDSQIDINNFKFNFDIYNFLSIDPDVTDIVNFNKINDEYQTKTFSPKYLNLEFSETVDDVKTYKRNVNDNEITYAESDATDKKIYSIRRELKIFNTTEHEAIKQYFAAQASNLDTLKNEVYPEKTINASSIDTITAVLNNDSFFATALYTPVIIEEYTEEINNATDDTDLQG